CAKKKISVRGYFFLGEKRLLSGFEGGGASGSERFAPTFSSFSQPCAQSKQSGGLFPGATRLRGKSRQLRQEKNIRSRVFFSWGKTTFVGI
ncbi:MAG: hypothetical protein J6D37_01010, partial [Clostridia bacterium]|nr:hypothetical protein [Clostridia bacterium]